MKKKNAGGRYRTKQTVVRYGASGADHAQVAHATLGLLHRLREKIVSDGVGNLAAPAKQELFLRGVNSSSILTAALLHMAELYGVK